MELTDFKYQLKDAYLAKYGLLKSLLLKKKISALRRNDPVRIFFFVKFHRRLRGGF